jgi:hypothetical protein
VYILNPQTPVLNDKITANDRIYISKYSKNAEIVLKLMESICVDRSIYDVIRYGEVNTDYELNNARVKYLFNKAAVNDADTYKKTHTYRVADNFKFLLNSKFERYDSRMPLKYEQEISKINRDQNELPFEKLVKENRYANLQDIASGIRQSIFGESVKSGNNSTGGKCNIDDLSQYRAGKIFQLFDQIWSPDFEKLYDEFVKSQNPKDIEAIKEYYRELVKRLKK